MRFKVGDRVKVKDILYSLYNYRLELYDMSSIDAIKIELYSILSKI